MNGSRRFILGVCAAWSAVLLMPSMVGLAQRGPAKPLVDATNKRMQPEDVVMNGSGSGIVTVPVFGDASKPGMYIVRNRFPAGITSRPHFHDQDRFVTVIKGTWWTDEGDVFRADKMVPIKTGGSECRIEGLPMGLLRLGKCAVNVENEGSGLHRLPTPCST